MKHQNGNPALLKIATADIAEIMNKLENFLNPRFIVPEPASPLLFTLMGKNLGKIPRK